MLILYGIALLISQFTVIQGFSSCSTSSIGFCLRSLFDVWEHVRNVETHAANLLFPVPFYTRQSILILCNEYIETKSKCFVDGELGCRQSPMVSFVQSHLDFYCGTHFPIYSENYECISANILRNRQCYQHIYGIPNPMSDKDKCEGLPKYFDCVKDSLKTACGDAALALVGSSIKSFGCELDKDLFDISQLKKLNESGKYTQQYLEDFVLMEKPANLDELRKSKELSAETPNETTVTTSQSTTTPVPSTTEKLIATTTAQPVETSSTPFIAGADFDQTFETSEDQSSEDQPFDFSSSMLDDHKAMLLDETLTTPETLTTATEKVAETTSVAPAIVSNSSEIVQEALLNLTAPFELDNSTVLESTTQLTTPFDDSDICTPDKEEKINVCYQHLIRRLATVTTHPDSSQQIRFPVFNVSLTEVIALCGAYEEATTCSEKNHQICYDTQIVQFFSGQLETLCFRLNSMKQEYQCMLQTFNENPNCVRFLKSDDNQAKCANQQEAFDCLQSSVICPEQQQTIILIKEIIRGYGCRVYFKHYLTKPPITHPPTTRRTRRTTTAAPVTSPSDVEGSGESTEIDRESTNSTLSDDIPNDKDEITSTPTTITTTTIAQTSPQTEATETTLMTTTNPTTLSTTEQVEDNSRTKNQPRDRAGLVRDCPKKELDQVRECMAPLLETWLRIHSKKPLLSEITFPVYSYTPREMLDLCDGYANLFLCSGVNQIKRCLKDQLIEAAQDFLGYQCSPPNLPTFMKYYQCIKNVDSSFGCSRFIRGSVATTRKRKCDGFHLYVNCMVPLVQSSCGLDAIRQFNFTVTQFGCNRRQV